MNAAAEIRRNPVSKHHTQPEYGDEQAGAGRGTAEPVLRDQQISLSRTGTENIYFPCSADHKQDWQPCPADPYSMTINAPATYIIMETTHYYSSQDLWCTVPA